MNDVFNFVALEIEAEIAHLKKIGKKVCLFLTHQEIPMNPSQEKYLHNQAHVTMPMPPYMTGPSLGASAAPQSVSAIIQQAERIEQAIQGLQSLAARLGSIADRTFGGVPVGAPGQDQQPPPHCGLGMLDNAITKLHQAGTALGAEVSRFDNL